MTRRIRTAIVFLAMLAPLVGYAVLFITDSRLAFYIFAAAFALFLILMICRVLWLWASGIVEKNWPPKSEDGPDAC